MIYFSLKSQNVNFGNLTPFRISKESESVRIKKEIKWKDMTKEQWLPRRGH